MWTIMLYYHICSLGNFICYAKHLKICLQDDVMVIVILKSLKINYTANWPQ